MMDDQGQMFEEFLRRVRGMIGQDPQQWAPNMQDVFRDFAGADPQEMPAEQRANMVRELVRMWEGIVADMQAGQFGGGGDGGMPGAFPP
jgi:hypothetical protein